MQKILSLEELKIVATHDDKKPYANFFIQLKGNLRSSKKVVYYPDTNTFDIYNEIDDTWEENVPEEQLINETHIAVAIKEGIFYKYDF